MKKYLMTGIATLAMGGTFTSCGPDMSSYSGNPTEQVVQNYESKFVQAFGEPAPNQTWGFGSSTVAGARGMTRTLPEKPSFRDTNPIAKPTMPSYSNTVPDGAKYARDYQNYQNGDVIYINTEYQQLNNPQNTENLTIYVDGNVTYVGQTNQNGNGTVICVTENSTLRLGAVSNNLTVYLAPGATLDVRKGLKENVINYWPYESEIVETGSNSFSFQKEHAAIYMSAGCTVKATDLTLIEGAKLLNNGGTIEATNLTLDQKATLWNEGTIKVTNTLTLTNESSALYNQTGKTITAGSLLMNNNNDLLYNDGTVDIDGNIKLNNTAAEIINNNSLECTSLEMYAGAKFHNVGTVNMTGKTYVENTNSRWMNDGQYTCGEFELTGGINPTFVFNNCKLTVNGNFHQNHGAFSLDANGSVICESFTWDSDGYFYMGSKSLLKVAGDLLARNQNSGGYGFRGEGDDYAVIQAGSIKKESEGQYRAAYYGKLYIDTDNHFAQGGTESQPWYYYENTVKFSKNGDASPVTIPATACNPGFGNSGGGSDNTESIRVIGEDLTINSNSDFDFNDIVFDVIRKNGKIYVKFLAAGGELPIYIGPDNNSAWELHGLFADKEKEVAEKGGKTARNITTKTMMNTRAGKHQEYPCPELELPSGWWDSSKTEISDIANSIEIRVQKSGTLFVLKAPKGEAPSKIAVGTEFDWCNERDNIDDIYNGNFKKYVEGESGYEWNTWYNK